MPPCGFDSPHLHRVSEAFPRVNEGVTCGAESQLTRRDASTATRTQFAVAETTATRHSEWPDTRKSSGPQLDFQDFADVSAKRREQSMNTSIKHDIRHV